MTELPEGVEIVGPYKLPDDEYYTMGWKAFWNNKTYGNTWRISTLDLTDFIMKRILEDSASVRDLTIKPKSV